MQALEILAPSSEFSPYASIGPMELAELTLTPFALFGPGGKDRFDLPARYEISHFFAASQSDVVDRWQLPPNHDGSLSFGWERRLSLLSSVRAEGGLAVAYQPALCVPPAPPSFDCSIDHSAPGIRGSAGAPPLELHLGRKSTGTFVGQVTLSRRDRERVIEVQLFRGYEPNYYASALALTDRLAGTGTYRIGHDVLVTASLQFAHLGFSSPAQVFDIGTGEQRYQLSPQNRTIYLMMASAGVDWAFSPRLPLSFFAQADYQGLLIRAEQVDTVTINGTVQPNPAIEAYPPLGMGDYVGTSRIILTTGLRLFTRPPPREFDVLVNARTLP